MNRFILVTNASKCEFGSESLLYLSITSVFHLDGSGVSMMSFMKGWSQFSILWTYWVTERVLSLHVMSTSSGFGRWFRWVPGAKTCAYCCPPKASGIVLLGWCSPFEGLPSLGCLFASWHSSPFAGRDQGMIVKHLTQDVNHGCWAPIFRGSHGRHAKQVDHLP